MLLRLRVRGFKNLRDAEVRFGPLTCFVGPNGVGKSNLFDAIQFLRALADSDIQTAAQSVRSPVAGTFGPRDLFWAGDPRTRISFLADMIVPAKVVDDFGREATPTTTLLNTHSPDVVRQLTEDEVLFVDAVEGPEGRSARVSALEGGWRKGVLTTPLRRMADFIGGSPLGPMAKQLELRFPLAFGSVR